jgi:hypothetical protein
MACPELKSLTLRAIEIGETNAAGDPELVVAVCLRALRHLAAEIDDVEVQNMTATGLWRILTDGVGPGDNGFRDAMDAVVDCVGT